MVKPSPVHPAPTAASAAPAAHWRRCAAALLIGGAMATLSLPGQARDYVQVTVGGQVTPGVYGEVHIGNRPPPPVYAPRPVVIVPVAAPRPVYLYVPDEHRRHWRYHCGRYDACARPVYFVQAAPSYRDGGHRHGRDRWGRGHPGGHWSDDSRHRGHRD